MKEGESRGLGPHPTHQATLIPIVAATVRRLLSAMHLLTLHVSSRGQYYLGDPMIVPIFQVRKHAQRGLLTCPMSHSGRVAERQLERGAVCCQRLRASHLDTFSRLPLSLPHYKTGWGVGKWQSAWL